MLGIVAAYLLGVRALRVPQGMWRFSGFGEVQRLALACALAGRLGGGGADAAAVEGAACGAGAAPRWWR
jgi:hypothetical protein